jgi:hypothetical protein
MASYGVLEEHTILDPDFSILAFAFCWACGLSWNEAWANVKSLLLDIPMSRTLVFLDGHVSGSWNKSARSPFLLFAVSICVVRSSSH